jgi:protein-L-isoaspartate O-methyltransferase
MKVPPPPATPPPPAASLQALDIGGHLIMPLRVKKYHQLSRFVHTKAARATLSEEALDKVYTSFLKPLGPLPLEINDPSQLTQF